MASPTARTATSPECRFAVGVERDTRVEKGAIEIVVRVMAPALEGVVWTKRRTPILLYRRMLR